MGSLLGRQRKTGAVLFILAVCSGSTRAISQEVRVLSEEVRQFVSPLVIELSLDPLLEKPVGEKWSTDKTKLFSCRGVTIESIEFRVKPDQTTPHKRVEASLRLNNNSGKDKFATFRFETSFAGEVTIIGVSNLMVEQGDSEKTPAVLALVPVEQWRRLPRPMLRVTMTLKDY